MYHCNRYAELFLNMCNCLFLVNKYVHFSPFFGNKYVHLFLNRMCNCFQFFGGDKYLIFVLVTNMCNFCLLINPCICFELICAIFFVVVMDTCNCFLCVLQPVTLHTIHCGGRKIEPHVATHRERSIFLHPQKALARVATHKEHSRESSIAATCCNTQNTQINLNK